MWPEFVSRSVDGAMETSERKVSDGEIHLDSDRDRRYSILEVFSLQHREDLTRYQKYYWRFMLLKNLTIIILGFIALIIGTYCSVRDIIVELGK